MTRTIYFLAQRLRGEDTPEKLAELDRMQWLQRGQIELQQRQMVEDTLRYAAEHVPFYRKRLRGIRGFGQLGRARVLTREEVMNHVDSLISEECSKSSLLNYQSSGSTGEPVTLYFTPDTMGYFHAAQYRGFSWYGMAPTDKCMKFWGVPFKRAARLKEYAKDFVMNRTRISAFNMSEEAMAACYRKARRFKPSFLYGYALALYHFGHYLKEKGKDGLELNLKAIISTSEVLHEYQRCLLEEVFGCKVINEYGAAEVGIIGFECPEGSIHITSENVYLEVLKDGTAVEEGEVGEVVVTGLRNRAMPLIRYTLGDLAVLTQEYCLCGRQSPLIKSIEGRNNDKIVTENGRVLHSELFAYINRDLIEQGFLLKEFKIIQETKKKLKVLVPKNTEKHTLVALRQQVKRHIGMEMQVVIDLVDTIPREKSGKVRYCVSELPGS
jgi:phenylacetate-CoA ligase